MGPTIDPDILSGFMDEVTGYVPAIRDGLRRYADAPSADVLEEATRFAHTIKGAAALVGLNDLSHIAYHLEGLLEGLGDGRVSASADRLAAIDEAVNQVAEYVAHMRAGGGDPQPLRDASALLAELTPDPFSSDDAIPRPPLSDDTADNLPAFGAADTQLDLPAFAPPPWDSAPLPDFDLPAFPPVDFDTPPPVAAERPLVADGPTQELVEVFRLEAEDHLRVLTTVLPETRSGTVDADRWQEVRRAAHSLKGAAAMVGFGEVTKLAHRMEDLLDLYFEGKRAATPDEIDLLLAATDAIEDSVAGRGDPAVYPGLYERFAAVFGGGEEDVPTPTVVEQPSATPSPAVDRSAAALTVRVPVDKLAEVSKLTGEQVITRSAFEQRMTAFARLLEEFQASTSRLRRASGRLDTEFEASALGGGKGAAGGSAEGFDALEFDRYTEFHLISRELSETASDLQTLADELGHVFTDFDGYLTRQARLASETEDKLTRLRMVPLGSVSGKLHRTVRQAATQSGKKAEFVLEGDRTGLDKTVLDAMADPLLHLLRNAVDHGLEPGEVRQALGKPATGTVRLRAEHEGSQVVLTIDDDGRGIDPDAVRETAVRRGLVDETAAAALDADQLAAFLFAPGFSTKGEVTELSGRGVGLDVVKSKVEALKGTVAVTSRAGAGTTFTVRLPMTLAVVRALVVRANQEQFAVPLEAVEQIRRLDPADTERIGREPVLRVNGEMYPVVRLGDKLGLAKPADATDRPPVVLLKAGGRRAAVVVDALLGGREVVVKRVGPQVRRSAAVAGATLTGDGSVVLILNPVELVRPTGGVVAPVAPRATVEATRRGLAVLIVDDSPSVRRVLTGLAQRAGWHATTAKDGMEALETLQRTAVQPDVVLTDVEMPRMDGYELLATLRGQPSTRELPVVVITSRAADKHRKKAMDLGASAYLVKPYQDDSLVEVVRRLTRSRVAAAVG